MGKIFPPVQLIQTKMHPRTLLSLGLACALTSSSFAAPEETLSPLKDGKPPQNFEELWAGYDPRKEPLDVEVLKEWEEDGVVLRVFDDRLAITLWLVLGMAGVDGGLPAFAVRCRLLSRQHIARMGATHRVGPSPDLCFREHARALAS